MRQILSPMQMLQKEQNREILLAKAMVDLMAVHKEFLAKHEEIKKMVSTAVKGDKGDRPSYAEIKKAVSELMPHISQQEVVEILRPNIERTVRSLIPIVKDGRTPTESEITSIIKKVMPKRDTKITVTSEHLDMIAEKIGGRIKVNELDPNDIIDQIMALPEDKRLATKKHVDGLEQTISAFQHQLKRGYLHGGGISSLIAGTGITLVKNSDGSYTITSSGGNFVDNEVVSGSGTTFTLANTPVSGSVKVYGLGQRLVLATDYTISGSTITTINSWNAGEITSDYRV